MKNSKEKTMRFLFNAGRYQSIDQSSAALRQECHTCTRRKAINICPDFLDQIDKPELSSVLPVPTARQPFQI